MPESAHPITIDCNSLANLLLAVRAPTIIGLHARTIPAMNKTNNPYWGRIVKEARLTAVIGASYQSAVNRRRLKQAIAAGSATVSHFHETSRTWGRHARSPSASSRPSRPSPLILHNGKRYLNLQRQTVLACGYRYASSGRPVDVETIAPFLKKSSDEAAARRQELKRPVIYRDYTLENILQLRMHGKIYVIQSRVEGGESRAKPKAA